MDPNTDGKEPQPSLPTSATTGNPETLKVLTQPDSSPAPAPKSSAKPKSERKPKGDRKPKAPPKPKADATRHWYLTARPSEKHGPMGHFHHLKADEAARGLRSGVLVVPTADQLRQRHDGPAE